MAVKKPRIEPFITLIMSSVICSVIFFFILYNLTYDWKGSLFLGCFYCCFHPFFGKIFCSIALKLCNLIDDKYFKNETWGTWEASSKLYFVSFWPIVAPFIIIFVSISYVVITMYEMDFNEKNRKGQ
jgi:hypothetical protein